MSPRNAPVETIAAILACWAVAIVSASAEAHADGPSRRDYVAANGVPEKYAAAEPVGMPPSENLGRGAALYGEHCAGCHGEKGRGDGEDGAYYDPLPSNLVEALVSPVVTDGYLLWTIAEGGQPVASGMTAYRDKLSAEDMWAIIHFIRAEFGR